MALKIDQGLFSSDFTDHHAILGVSVEAPPKDIRKRYLKIARRLHPDSSALKTEAEKQLAHELLSKLVNPAYEKLMQENDRAEYALILKLKGKQANQQQETILLTTQAAGKLASNTNYEVAYNSILVDLSTKQYESLEETLDITGQISELNLVYLMKQAQTGDNPPLPPRRDEKDKDGKRGKDDEDGKGGEHSKDNKGDKGQDPKLAIFNRYLDRAKTHEAQGNFPAAIQELREALKLNPRSGECHNRLGNIYFKAKQLTMAKVHFNQALKLNPNDVMAKAALRRLDPNAKVASNNKSSSGKSSGKQVKAKGSGKSGGGLFGLFGSKKK